MGQPLALLASASTPASERATRWAISSSSTAWSRPQLEPADHAPLDVQRQRDLARERAAPETMRAAGTPTAAAATRAASI